MAQRRPTDKRKVKATGRRLGAGDPVGGSGTGIAQDATLQAMIAELGGSPPEGGSGTGIAQDASLQAILALLSGGGAGSKTAAIIYRPGVASSPPAVETWGEVASAIAAADGAITVFVDSSHAAATVPASSGVTDCMLATTFVGYQTVLDFALPGATVDVLTIDDGATLHRPRAISQFLTIACDSKTTASMTFTTLDTLTINNSSLITTLTATRAAISVTGDTTLAVTLNETALIGQPTAQPVFTVAAGSTIALTMEEGSEADPSAISGAGALNLAHDDTVPLITFSGFTGALTEFRNSLTQWDQPSAGVTASRPTQLLTGQLYFDTTLQSLIVWNGTRWVLATPNAHAWGDSGSVPAISDSAFTVLAETSITPTSTGKLRVIGTGIVQSGAVGSLSLQVGVGYASAGGPAEAYGGDPNGILCTGTGGGGTNIGTTISISYEITGLTLGTTYTVAIMGQASGVGLLVAAHGIQVDAQEVNS